MNTNKLTKLIAKLDLLELTARGQVAAISAISTELHSEYIVTHDTIDCMIAQEWGDILETLNTIH